MKTNYREEIYTEVSATQAAVLFHFTLSNHAGSLHNITYMVRMQSSYIRHLKAGAAKRHPSIRCLCLLQLKNKLFSVQEVVLLNAGNQKEYLGSKDNIAKCCDTLGNQLLL